MMPTRFTLEEAQQIYEQKRAGVNTSALITLLQGRHHTFITGHSVFNAFMQVKEHYRGDRSDAEVLIDQLQTAGIPFRVCANLAVGFKVS